MADSATEPFPPLSPVRTNTTQARGLRRQRKSSNLGDDPRGDTGTVALATAFDNKPPSSSSVARSDSSKQGRPSKRRKAKSLLRRWWKLSLRHTWLNPLLIVSIIVSLYLANPSESNPLHAALFLSYPLPKDPSADPSAPIQYGKGAKDFAFVAFYIVVLSFSREFLMQRLIRPLAIYCGIKSRAKQARFMEQVYTAIYFGISGPFGLYVMSRTPVWYFNTTGMYEGFPHKTHEALFKAYYLLQASYWAQQAIVLLLMLEKPRKDFKELVMHHIITIALIWLSYRFHFTYMGLAVYITHDISDFFLATSKTLNYLDSTLVGPYFGFFIFVWTYLRHFINLRILWSMVNGEFSSIGPFELNWETQQYKCWISQYITFSLLASLQAVNLFWLFLILRIAWRFVATWGEVVEDERSDYEDEVEETEPQTTSNGLAPESKPQLLLNGEPVSPIEGGNSSALMDAANAKRRKAG
ncbi:acyl-CoA-dependent ceramide synthase [Phyllosticta citriasiana]|uniref:Acyl-CoA-dependent ceramide synthase n=1 Tax=Phyllosticta citriasiana TaxID=595635 RepID=A0ABR1KTC5_9PEZI